MHCVPVKCNPLTPDPLMAAQEMQVFVVVVGVLPFRSAGQWWMPARISRGSRREGRCIPYCTKLLQCDNSPFVPL